MNYIYSNLREGDLIFVDEPTWFGYKLNVYILCKPYGRRLFYAAGYCNKKFQFRVLKDLNIKEVRRHIGSYHSTEEQVKLRQRLILKHEEDSLGQDTEKDILKVLHKEFELVGGIEDYLNSCKFINICWRN